MATYKVIQDIEAEDKLLGPLTLRQFIYAIIVVVSAFIAFKLATAAWFLALPFLPVMIFFATLAAPFGHDQSSEVWLLAKVRFFLKPRRRIWDQSGLKQLVNITAPKQIERPLTKDISQNEVHSRLKALANTIDSRGWAVKNPDVNLFSGPAYITTDNQSDRLVDPSVLPQEASDYDAQPADDIFDTETSATAQNLSKLMAASAASHKQQAVEQMKQPTESAEGKKAAPVDYWFLNEPSPNGQNLKQRGLSAFDSSRVVTPGQEAEVANNPISDEQLTAEEKVILEKAHTEKERPNPAYGHMRVIQPLSGKNPGSPQGTKAAPSVTTPSNPAIIELARNDDLNVETIQRQGNKSAPKKPPDDEVVVSLR